MSVAMKTFVDKHGLRVDPLLANFIDEQVLPGGLEFHVF
jgi:hypothetical protein